MAALKRLPVGEREAITLHHLLDLPAARTGAPLSRIKTRLARGRRTLAGLLGDEPTEEYSHA